MVTWNGRSGFAIARNLDIGGARHARSYRAPPGYAGGPPPGYPDRPPAVYEAGPPVIYGAPAYYAPARLLLRSSILRLAQTVVSKEPRGVMAAQVLGDA
jgi:hypothetical protein